MQQSAATRRGAPTGNFSRSFAGRAIFAALILIVIFGALVKPPALLADESDGARVSQAPAQLNRLFRSKGALRSNINRQQLQRRFANESVASGNPVASNKHEQTADTVESDSEDASSSSNSIAVAGDAKQQKVTRRFDEGLLRQSWKRMPPVGPDERFLTFNDLYPWYGLTNMMLCYAAGLRYAFQDNRSVVFPTTMPANFYELFDAQKTAAELASVTYAGVPPPIIVIRLPSDVPQALRPPVSMNKKHLYLPQRVVYRTQSSAVLNEGLAVLATIQHRSKKHRFVRHHNFFMRFPWAPSMEPYDECFFLSSLVLSDAVTAYHRGLRDAMKAAFKVEFGAYVAVHLRLELDAQLIRPKKAPMPSPYQLREFLLGPVVRAAKALKGVTALYLCSGSIDKSYLPVLDDVERESGLAVLHFGKVAPFIAAGLSLPSVVGEQRESHKTEKGVRQTQDHYRSAVEYLILGYSATAVMPIYSSFKFAVFATRCSPKWKIRRRKLRGGAGIAAASDDDSLEDQADHPANDVGADGAGMLTYDINMSGEFVDPRPATCPSKSRGWCGEIGRAHV